MKKNNHHKNKKNHRNHLSIEDVKDLLSRLENQYRKANISEKDYKALKEKYSKRLGLNNMTKKEVKKEEEIEEITPEVIERLATQLSQQDQIKETEEKAEKEKKGGFFGKLFGKKKEETEQDKEKTKGEKESQTVLEQTIEQEPEPQIYEETESYHEPKFHVSETSKKVESLEVEIEKLKTILETIREGGHITEETIQTISEGIGELRSLVFQTDASLKETMVKMEKIEDDVSEVQPKEIVKKFREIDAQFEKYNLEAEKFQTKLEDANEKLNKMYEIMKSIGGIENLVDINKKIQEKLRDVDEAVKYIGRIGAKTEKQFMDLSRGLEDLVLFKAKQEDLDESLKDILKNIDGLNIKFEGYVSKKDLDVFREDIMLLKKQLENVNKVLPIIDVKLPQDIIDLRKERDDILLLLDSLEEQYNTKKITKAEYMSFKEGNEKRIKEIDKQLEKEWKKVERMIKSSEKEKSNEQQIETVNVEEQAVETSQAEDIKKEIKEEENEEEEKEEVKEKMEEVKELFEKKKKGPFEEKVEKKEEETQEVKPEEEKDKEKVEEIAEEKKKEISKPEKKDTKIKPKIKIKKIRKIVRNKKPKPVGKESGRAKILSEIKKMKI